MRSAGNTGDVLAAPLLPSPDLGGLLVQRRPAWQAEAACTGSDIDLFFTERGESTSPAKQVCGTCPVRDDCLEYALDTGEKFGIWGGLSERERRRLRRARSRAKKGVASCAP